MGAEIQFNEANYVEHKGVRGRVKKKALKSLINKEKPDFICIQETKMACIESKFWEFLWGDSDFDWVFKLPEGRSRGILSI